MQFCLTCKKKLVQNMTGFISIIDEGIAMRYPGGSFMCPICGFTIFVTTNIGGVVDDDLAKISDYIFKEEEI